MLLPLPMMLSVNTVKPCFLVACNGLYTSLCRSVRNHFRVKRRADLSYLLLPVYSLQPPTTPIRPAWPLCKSWVSLGMHSRNRTKIASPSKIGSFEDMVEYCLGRKEATRLYANWFESLIPKTRYYKFFSFEDMLENCLGRKEATRLSANWFESLIPKMC